MRILWTPTAADNLESIADYLYEQNPASADQIVRRVYQAPAILRQFPNSGRVGRKEGTRELVLPSLPYIIVYEVRGNNVRLLRVLHGAQRWP